MSRNKVKIKAPIPFESEAYTLYVAVIGGMKPLQRRAGLFTQPFFSRTGR